MAQFTSQLEVSRPATQPGLGSGSDAAAIQPTSASPSRALERGLVRGEERARALVRATRALRAAVRGQLAADAAREPGGARLSAQRGRGASVAARRERGAGAAGGGGDAGGMSCDVQRRGGGTGEAVAAATKEISQRSRRPERFGP